MTTSDSLDPKWTASAERWIRDRLDALAMPPVGPVEQVRVRPWSAHLRVPTRTGMVWFKANRAGSAYEAGLVAALVDWAPDAVLAPLAVDTDRGWLLSPDGGQTMREAAAGTPDLAQWEAMLTAYAQVQRDVTSRTAEMMALGVPDQRPEAMPGHLARLLDDPDVRTDLGPERHAELTALAPQYGRWCAELAADGIPATVQHDDLHDGNVFIVDGNYRFFDWGDACVSHPFCSLLVALRVAAYLFKLEPGAPELARLRDAYLEVWPGERADLARSAELAARVGIVGRALSWQRALGRTEVAEWLCELLPVDSNA